ncbi:MAG: sigma-54 dependent transcriptional regulator [Proteobacteria bacterium]|nr:sigma-54 dependent transcriptional regulator [Pseudomonadota bacterium]
MADPKGRVLIVDDETNAREALAELLGADGYVTRTATDGQRALAVLEGFDPDVVLTDLKMPRLDGLGLLERAKPNVPHTAFIVMTAFGSIDTAVRAIQQGAESYVTKPVDMSALSAALLRAVEKAQLSREAARLREQVTERYSFGSIIGNHPSMQRLLKQVAQVARSRATVLIHGESGTGKELIAAAIHHNSKRRGGPFVRLNCAALAQSLLESELLGHERGAFTGATGRREGRFRQAHGGTLFLDEVSEIPPAVQVKLLRFLQEREFERVGGNETLRVDVRVVAATNCSLEEGVKDGTFREDLYYRLHVVKLEVPPLRVRKSDIPVLAHHFFRKYAEQNEVRLQGFSNEAIRHLMTYPWPGNVRELENAIERAVVMNETGTIEVGDFPAAATSGPAGDMSMLVPGLTLGELERMAILQTLEAVGGSTAKAAELLGISRRKIQYRLKEWGETARAEREG